MSPSSKKSLLSGGAGGSVSRPAVTAQSTDTRVTTTASAATTAVASRGHKQSATVAPISQLSKVMGMIMIMMMTVVIMIMVSVSCCRMYVVY